MDKKALGSRIQKYRSECHLTQSQLAEKVGVEEITIRHIELGRSFPSISVFANISNALDVRPEYLLYDEIHEARKYVLNELISEKIDKLSPGQFRLMADIVSSILENIET